MNFVPINPDDTDLALQWAKEVLVTNCTFRYFDSIPGSATPNTLWAWYGVLALHPRMENVTLLNNYFNGNVGMTTYATNWASDGIIWLGHGGPPNQNT